MASFAQGLLLLALLQVPLALALPHQFSVTAGGMMTFYGDQNGNGLQGGACGYQDLNNRGIGMMAAAGNGPLFSGGFGCGACYKVWCVNNQWCKAGTSVIVTITDECPGGCGAGTNHLDMSQPAFDRIANKQGGIIPIQFMRVPCSMRERPPIGGLRFTVTGSNYYQNVLVWNVNGAGAVNKMQLRCRGGPNQGWQDMRMLWGATYVRDGFCNGGGLDFRVFNDMGGMVEATNIGDPSGDPNKFYQSSVNFGGGGGGSNRVNATPRPRNPARKGPKPTKRRGMRPGMRRGMRRGGHHPKGRGHHPKGKGMRKPHRGL